MQLSRRLEAVAALVSPGLTLADVGTDHGYIPVELVRRGVTPSAIAMDVKEGPLGRAREHIQRAGLEALISTRLSDGFKNLRPGEAQCAVIAGMGGALMQKILSDSPEVVVSLEELVLQPQSEVPAFRSYLAQHGFTLLAEDMVLEDGKYYPMMKVAPPGQLFRSFDQHTASGRGSVSVRTAAGSFNQHTAYRPGRSSSLRGAVEERSCDDQHVTGSSFQKNSPVDSALAMAYGPMLLLHRHPVLKSYLEWERDILERIPRRICTEGAAGDPAARKRLEEVNEKLKLNARAEEYLKQGADLQEI